MNLKRLTPLFLALALAFPLAAGSARKPAHPVDLNTASVTELMQLPRVGQKTAERIVAFRKEHGGFRRVEEVLNVRGIGEKSFAQLKPLLTLNGNGTPAGVRAVTPKATKAIGRVAHKPATAAASAARK